MAAEFVSPSAKLTVKFNGGSMSVTNVKPDAEAEDFVDFLNYLLPTCKLAFKGAEMSVTRILTV